MQLLDEYVQCRARTLRNYFHAKSVGQVTDMAAKPQAAAGAGYKETESHALHAAVDGGVQALPTFGSHVREARPVRARLGAVRG